LDTPSYGKHKMSRLKSRAPNRLIYFWNLRRLLKHTVSHHLWTDKANCSWLFINRNYKLPGK